MKKRQPIDRENMLDRNGQELKGIGSLPHDGIGDRKAMTQPSELRLDDDLPNADNTQ
jgi:hypothetical protein